MHIINQKHLQLNSQNHLLEVRLKLKSLRHHFQRDSLDIALKTEMRRKKRQSKNFLVEELVEELVLQDFSHQRLLLKAVNWMCQYLKRKKIMDKFQNICKKWKKIKRSLIDKEQHPEKLQKHHLVPEEWVTRKRKLWFKNLLSQRNSLKVK